MSKKITMQIPTKNGDQLFYLGKGTVATLLLSITAFPLVLVAGGIGISSKANNPNNCVLNLMY